MWISWFKWIWDQQPRMSARIASVADFEKLRKRVKGSK